MQNLRHVLAIGLILVFTASVAFAQHTSEEAAGEEREAVVEVGNKICPVSGEKIEEKEAYQIEHEGKIYNLCCKACMKDFKKDPDKYIKKIEEELKKRTEQEKEAMPAPEMPGGMTESHQHH
ncbi:MAG: YHS domain-containing protein [Candidatus Omnitrophota bacterium]